MAAGTALGRPGQAARNLMKILDENGLHVGR
jgi:hypothetical protein